MGDYAFLRMASTEGFELPVRTGTVGYIEPESAPSRSVSRRFSR